MKHFLISPSKEVNCILWDGVSPYPVADGWLLLNEADFAAWRVSNPPPPPTAEQLTAQVRAERDTLLTKSDVNVLPDRWAAMTPEKQAAWATYRQALRDIPQQAGFPQNVIWPTKPE